MNAANEFVAKQQKTVETSMEERHLEEFKTAAKAMSDDEKYIVLKSIPSDVLIDEIRKRMNLLEKRNKAIKDLFNNTVDD